MTAQLAHWLLLVAFAQAPQEAALLKFAPADVDIAIRTRGLEAASNDLVASVKAMNPDWGNMIEGVLAGPMAQVREHHGARAFSSPFLAFMRLSEIEGGGPPPFAVIFPSKEYKETLKEIAGGKDVELKPQDGGYDAFDAPDGNGQWYAAKSGEHVAFGSSKGLIADIAKGGGKRLDTVLTGPAAKSFFAGDVGVYVNAASLSTRFADQIDQARQALMAAMEQQGGNPGVQIAKDFYDAMFDSLKYADVVTLNADFAEKGIHLAGFLKLKAGSELAKSIPTLTTRGADAVGTLPGDAAFYVYMNLGAKSFERLQGMSLKVINKGKPSPEVEKATAALHALGRVESASSVTMDKGMKSFSVIRSEEPQKFMDASIALLKAMASGESQVYKNVKVEPAAQTYGGHSFTHVSVDLNMEKLAELGGNNPGQAEAMKSILTQSNVSYWYGTDGKTLLQIVAPTWDDAKGLIDGHRKTGAGVGQTTGFKSVRSEMPDQANFIMLISAQGITRLYASLFSAMTKNPDLKAPDDMPKEPAYIGVSLTPHPAEGYELHFVVPAEAGPVISKGLIPVFQGAISRPNP